MLSSCAICFLKRVTLYFMLSATLLKFSESLNSKFCSFDRSAFVHQKQNMMSDIRTVILEQQNLSKTITNPLIHSFSYTRLFFNSLNNSNFSIFPFINRIHYTNFHNALEERQFYYNLNRIERNSRRNSVYLNVHIYICIYYFYWNFSKTLRKSYVPFHEKKVRPRHIRHEHFSDKININDINDITEKVILEGLVKFENKNLYLQKSITLGKLATELNTNVKHLSIVIKKHKADNFNQYLNRLRIDYIVAKLKTDDKFSRYKISHLSDLCGYSSPAAFTKSFIEIMKITPPDFIRSVNKDY